MIVLPQLFMMFAIAGIGVMLRRRGVITDPVIKGLSDIVTLATNPALLISVTQYEYTPRTLVNFLHVLWMGTVTLAFVMVAVYALCRRQDERTRPVVALVSALPNAGFMGLPIIRAMYGADGALYLAAIIVAFNLVIWTVGIALIDRSRFTLRRMFNPGFIASLIGMALFLLNVNLPDFLDAPLDSLAAVNTPLAMLVLGARLKLPDARSLASGNSLLIAAVKLAAMPLIALGLSAAFHLDPVASGALVIASAMPSAIMGQMVAEQYDRDAALAAQSVSVTSVLSLATIPLIAMLLGG